MNKIVMETSEIVSFPASNEISKENFIDCETSSANTENHLLGSTSSSQSINGSKYSNCCQFARKKTRNLGVFCSLLSAAILLTLGGLSIVWTPFEIFMNERLRMLPGFPPYEWWKNPPDEVLISVYIFNITNSEEFLNGTDSKLRLQEIGPIIFLEKLTHSNVTRNPNSTLSYVAERNAIFLPELNPMIDLNATLMVPNLAVLGMASYIWDASFFTKFALNLLIRNLKSEPIVKTTVNNYLWNFSDPILDVAQTVAPALVPVNNMGILSRIYSDFKDSVTVFIGASNGHQKYFHIDKYDGSEYLPGYGSDCADTLENATEGISYQQFLTQDSILFYWRKTMCKVVLLYYNSTVTAYGVDAYQYILLNNSFDRTYPLYLDCYTGTPDLPNGLSDVSKCYYDFPMASSFPHFLHGDDVLHSYVEGLEPNEEKHKSFVIVEPTTGIPIESRARSQSNLIIRPLSGFNEAIDKFSDIVLPMFWAEYRQVGLPWYIYSLMYFTVVILPHFQIVCTTLMIAGGIILIISTLKKQTERSIRIRLLKNKQMEFEKIFTQHK